MIQFLSRLFFWILRIFLPTEKVLNFPHGWDTLNIFAPYSFGGVPRKEFLRLYNESMSRKISSNEYVIAEYGSLNPNQQQFMKKYERSECIKKWFGRIFSDEHP
jgi:hypothetical protein